MRMRIASVKELRRGKIAGFDHRPAELFITGLVVAAGSPLSLIHKSCESEPISSEREKRITIKIPKTGTMSARNPRKDYRGTH